MSKETVIVLREGDRFIALDQASGGYPYMVDSPWRAQHWQTTAHAEAYRSKFPGSYAKWQIQEFRATLLHDHTPKKSGSETE
jgi:hypothetical protein